MKLFCTLSISLSLALAACGGKSSDGGTAPATGAGAGTGEGEGTDTAVAGKTCADVGANMEVQLRAGGAPDDIIAAVAPIGVSACTEDGWSQEAIDCYATAEDGAACESTLTEDQKLGVQNRFTAVMGGAATDEGGME